MEIKVKNCNSIDEAVIHIKERKLNIKYGINGTGKSTIAKALVLHSAKSPELRSLLPFKYRGIEDEDKRLPAVQGADAIQSIEVFDQAFINQFVFKEDDIIENSFEIFIKTKDYDAHMGEIEKDFLEIKTTFIANESLTLVIQDLQELSLSFGKPSKASAFHGSSAIAKSLGKGNKLAQIPESLKHFSAYLNSNVNVNWITWQIKGNQFVDISSSCPYCTSPTEDKKEVIKSVGKEFDAKTMEHLNKLKEVVERLSKYFSEETNQQFAKLFRNTTEVSTEGQTFLAALKVAIDGLISKLVALREISFFSLKDVEGVVEKITAMKIDLDFLSALKSSETQKIVGEINSALAKVITQAGKIQGDINKQKAQIEKTIREHKDGINTFLRYSGYPYSIEITSEKESYKMKLIHDDSDEGFTQGNNHLSFGERNAFSIILFMYYCLNKNPDLIILDDPISSFDRNKKFALMDALFRKETSFKGKTVLMLTHDLEPIIDMIYVKKDTFGQNTVASFLESNEGIVKEIPITSGEIISFTKVCAEVLKSGQDEILKLIHLRRLYEVWEEKNLSYQLLSNLFHKRDTPVIKHGGTPERDMTSTEMQTATDEIKRDIPGFDYKSVLMRLKDNEKMTDLYKNTTSRQAKVQIYRVMKIGEVHDNSVITKFINQFHHIENEYVMQLDPSKYESIPKFIIDECDKQLSVTVSHER